MFEQGIACRRQLDALAVALEQRDAERLLDLADGVTHGAGREVQLPAAALNERRRAATSKVLSAERGTGMRISVGSCSG